MRVKLLTEHHLVFLSLTRGCKGSSELRLSKCHIVGNHMLRLKLRCTPCMDQLMRNVTFNIHISFVVALDET